MTSHFVLNHYATFHTLFTLGKKENGQINKQCQKDQSHLFDSIKLWDLQYYSVKEIRNPNVKYIVTING